ncbi:MAG: prolipoprotein diacylglyceryl transferase [Ilumatobacteraceae bacterium]
MTVLITLVPADIPSPSSGTWTIGPLSLNAYGLMIALGVIVGVWLFGRRLEAKGIGTRDDANSIAIWGVLAGVIGARLYHVITDWERFEDDLGAVFAIWEGGLGIPGGMLAGILVGAYVGHVRRGIPLGPGLNAVAPALPLAQAIGRWGNYFNQELFGGPTDLPWALEIDPANRPAGFESDETFHPTFLYESLCNLALCGILLWIDKRFSPAGGRLLAMYVFGYGVIRFFVEGLRIDPADELGGLRWNQWVALACVVGGGLYLVATRDKPKDILIPASAAGPGGAVDGDQDAELTEGEVVDDGADPVVFDDLRDAEIEEAELVDDDSMWDARPADDDDDDDAEDADADQVDEAAAERGEGRNP